MNVLDVITGILLLAGGIYLVMRRRETGASIHHYYENLNQRRRGARPGWFWVGMVPGERLSEWMALALAAIGLAMGAAMVITSVK